ncbi:MAG TPA: hypothetical protein VMU10_04155 [Desulfomonilia bacterium]|nr:hypothetical protein [Desulfomonilia bacterium]
MGTPLRIARTPEKGTGEYLGRLRTMLDIEMKDGTTFAGSLPFSMDDTTSGSENELQTAVAGSKNNVDLPTTILMSSYYRNMLRRINAGDAPKKLLSDLMEYIEENREAVWENSWVWFPRKFLNVNANQIFLSDLHADKNEARTGRRTDVERFIIRRGSEECLRVPVSYLLKISLADALGGYGTADPIILKAGNDAMGHFLNDNTSPEISSFHPVLLSRQNGTGRAVASETAKRFLLVQVLLQYANRKFRLPQLGQNVMAYFSPHPPMRQRYLNNIISDSFYRELFMNPCLSGWNRGEDKYRYMHLCHQVLSRSQLNAVLKLKDSGIISNNLVVLPSISNISLANNGTHISIGSRKLSGLLGNDGSGFTSSDEKYLGDLVLKIMEHFLPLFVGTYSAAPYRLAFSDFHPEKALGFLPHQLDYTHLRMLWRRWKKKAHIDFLGKPLTPFGPQWIDRMLSSVLGLRGDFVLDHRLIDYFVSLLSTDESPALDGTPGNSQRLKKDLAYLGIFHEDMSVYLLYKLREYANMGFSGFEGRHYSLFESILDDMGGAASLQTLLTALAYKYILSGEITHAHIPDDPSLESERRQVFFGAAIGIPTFFIKKDTKNLFLRKIIARTEHTRQSRRYSGYVRVHNNEYRKALLEIIKVDASDLIESMGLEDVLEDLENRLIHPGMCSAASRITNGILAGKRKLSPMDVDADEFNKAAETFYRSTLRRRHMIEGLAVLREECRALDKGDDVRQCLKVMLDSHTPEDFISSVSDGLMNEGLGEEELRSLIKLILLTVEMDRRNLDDPSVC